MIADIARSTVWALVLGEVFAAVSTVAVASIGGAGAAGVLPEPLQQPFDRTVHSVVPGDTTGDRKPVTPTPAPRVSATFDKGGKGSAVDGKHIGEDGRSYSPRPEDAGKPSGMPSWPGTDRPDTAPSSRPYTQPTRPATGNDQRPTQPDRQGTAPQQPTQPTQPYTAPQQPAPQYPAPASQAPTGRR